MFDAKAWEIEIRSAITGEVVWHRCIAIGVAMTNQGPMPITLYQDDDSKLVIATGSPKLRLSDPEEYRPSAAQIGYEAAEAFKRLKDRGDI